MATTAHGRPAGRPLPSRRPGRLARHARRAVLALRPCDLDPGLPAVQHDAEDVSRRCSRARTNGSAAARRRRRPAVARAADAPRVSTGCAPAPRRSGRRDRRGRGRRDPRRCSRTRGCAGSRAADGELPRDPRPVLRPGPGLPHYREELGLPLGTIASRISAASQTSFELEEDPRPPRRQVRERMSGYDEERLGRLLAALPAAPRRGYGPRRTCRSFPPRSTRSSPGPMKAAAFPERLVADLNAAIEAEGYEAEPASRRRGPLAPGAQESRPPSARPGSTVHSTRSPRSRRPAAGSPGLSSSRWRPR